MKPEVKKLILSNLPYLIFVYLFGKLGQAYRLAAGVDLSEKLLHFMDGCSAAFANAAPSFHPFDLLIGVAGAAALRLMVYCKSKNAKKYRKGEEYGSARWGTAKDIALYIDPNFDNNILLTQTERLTMNNRPKDPKTARNKNVLVIGGSGSGKTRFFVKPNLMQCVSKDYPTSFVITDPKGSLIGEVGQLLQRSGYRIKVLNTINFSKSMRYNPFRYIHSEKDILKLVNTLICNTKGEGEKSAEDFWVKSERLLYSALIGYIWYEAPDEEMNFTTLLEMINASEAREDDPEFQSPVDQMFERLEAKDPDHFAVRQYKKFLLSAGKTRSSILISCGARLAPFDIREVRELMEDDELELDTIGDEKTALFLIMSDTDTTFNFILAMVQSQLIIGNKALLSINRTICTALDYAVSIGWRSDNPAQEINPCLLSTTPYFTSFLKDWLKLMKTQVKITTYSGYERTIMRKVIPYFDERYPKIRLDAVSAKHIQDYYSYELEENHVCANTVKHRHANIHKALSYAYKTDLIQSNPADKVELPKIEKYTGQFYNQKQIEELFRIVKGDPVEFGVITAAFYGLRRSEILGLRWNAIDFEEKTITIRHTLHEVRVNGKMKIVAFDTTKTKSSFRTLPLVPPFEEILLKMKREQEENRRLCGNCYCQEYLGYIYVNEIGDIMKPNFLTAHFSAVLKENDMPHIRFHDLRHSCASLLFAQGVSLKEIQAWLGHSTIGTTANIYTHLDENNKLSSANAILSILTDK